MDADGRPGSVRSPRRMLAAGFGLAVVLGLCALVVALRGPAEAPGRDIDIVIPAGTKAAIDRGDTDAGVPSRIEGRVGDTLHIINRDRALHVVGGFPVSAGQTIDVPLRQAGVTQAMCTAHPGKRMEIVVRPA